MPKSQLYCLIATAFIVIMCNVQTSKAFALKSETNSTSISSKTESSEGRTFGRIKRFQMLLIPVAFKMGVFSVVIGILLALTIKSVLIGKTILFLNLAFIIFKVGSFFSKFKHGGEWDHKKNIHIHLHGATAAGHQPPWIPPEYSYTNVAP